MKFTRLQAGYYFSRKQINGQHIVIEDAGSHWILRLEEGREISRHQTVKHCKFALNEWINGNAELITC